METSQLDSTAVTDVHGMKKQVPTPACIVIIRGKEHKFYQTGFSQNNQYPEWPIKSAHSGFPSRQSSTKLQITNLNVDN